ncbi:MAG: hypothetical protein U0176_23430 [Bacteroidia bacterium]
MQNTLGIRHHWATMLLFVLLLPLMGNAQTSRECFPLWQGFTQTWGYNHRIQRLGDWVERTGNASECKATLHHAAASGSGADSAAYEQHYAWVRSPLVQHREGVVKFSLSGREKQAISASERVRVTLPDLDEHCQAEVLLQGFDLRTSDGVKADKLHAFDLGIDSLLIDPVRHEVQFRIKTELLFSCSTAECEALNQIVDYQLEVHWIVVAGQGFKSLPSTFGSSRAWEKHDTAAALAMAQVALLGEARYADATAGIRGLHILLDREAHMLGWESRIQPLKYEKGLLTVALRIDFRQNSDDMASSYKAHFEGHPRPPAGCALKEKAGNIVWEMDVTMLQFEGADISYHSQKGGIMWHTRPGKQVDSAANAGYRETEVRD